MKREKAFIVSFCVLWIILGIVFATYYLNVYISNTNHIFYLVLSICSFAESLFVGFSLYLYLKELKKRFATIIYIISALLTIPVLAFTIFWFLYFIGIQILPPPQQ